MNYKYVSWPHLTHNSVSFSIRRISLLSLFLYLINNTQAGRTTTLCVFSILTLKPPETCVSFSPVVELLPSPIWTQCVSVLQEGLQQLHLALWAVSIHDVVVRIAHTLDSLSLDILFQFFSFDFSLFTKANDFPCVLVLPSMKSVEDYYLDQSSPSLMF